MMTNQNLFSCMFTKTIIDLSYLRIPLIRYMLLDMETRNEQGTQE